MPKGFDDLSHRTLGVLTVVALLQPAPQSLQVQAHRPAFGLGGVGGENRLQVKHVQTFLHLLGAQAAILHRLDG